MPRELKKNQHGTQACYNNGGCRCGPCRDASRLYRGLETRARLTMIRLTTGEIVNFGREQIVHTQRGGVQAQYLRVDDVMLPCCAANQAPHTV